MNPDLRPRQSLSQKVLWLALPLLLLLLASQYMSVARAPQTPPTNAAQGPPQPTQITIAIPRDSGSVRAEVTFEAFMARVNACECHVEAALLGQAVGKMDPDHVRVVYRDLDMPESQSRLRAMQIPAPCSGFAINKTHRFTVPSTIPSDRGKRTVDVLAMDRNWTMEDIHAALSQEYEKACGKPLPISKTDFVARVSEEMKSGRPDLVLHETPAPTLPAQ